MTNKAQDTYVIGFCKTAEAYGVDPEQLIKVVVFNALAKQASIMKLAQTPARTMKILREAVNTPLPELQNKVEALQSKLFNKLTQAGAHRRLGLLPHVATKAPGNRVFNIGDMLRDVLVARGGKPVEAPGPAGLLPNYNWTRARLAGPQSLRTGAENKKWFEELVKSLASQKSESNLLIPSK